jgi:hypothetical protein
MADELKKTGVNRLSPDYKKSTGKNRLANKVYEPTNTGKVLDFGKEMAAGVIKPFARGATNFIQASEIIAGKDLDKLSTPFSGDFLGDVKPLGQGKNFKEKVIDAIGGGLDMASNIPIYKGAGITWDMLKNIKKGSNAIKVLKTAAKPLILEGMAAGAMAGGGSSVQNQIASGEELSATKTLFDTAFGTAIGGAAAPILGSAFAVLGRILGGKTPGARKLFIKELENEYKVDLTTPESKYKEYMDKMGYEEIIPDSQLPVIEYGKDRLSKEKTPVIDIGDKETSTLPKGYKYQAETLPTQSSDIPVKEVSIKEVAKEIPTTVTPPKVIRFVDPTKKDLIDKTVADLDSQVQISENIPQAEQIKQREFAHTTNLQQVETINSHDLEYQLKVIRNEIQTDDAPKPAYIANVENIAQKMADDGDTFLAEELAKNKQFIKDPVSQTAQDLQSAQIAIKGNLTDTLIDIIERREAKLPKTILDNKKTRIEDIKKSITKMADSIRKNPVTRKMVSDLLSSIICK